MSSDDKPDAEGDDDTDLLSPGDEDGDGADDDQPTGPAARFSRHAAAVVNSPYFSDFSAAEPEQRFAEQNQLTAVVAQLPPDAAGPDALSPAVRPIWDAAYNAMMADDDALHYGRRMHDDDLAYSIEPGGDDADADADGPQPGGPAAGAGDDDS